MTAALAVTAPPVFDYEAQLDQESSDPWGRPWTVTFGFGKPAQGTYTEIAFAPEVAAQNHPERVLEEVVRQVVIDLYGTAWAFTYRPDQYDEAIARWSLRRRERVVVTSIEVWK